MATAHTPTMDYVVRPHDTLSRLAARFLGDPARWPELASLNGIRRPDLLLIGQKLRVPVALGAGAGSAPAGAAIAKASAGPPAKSAARAARPPVALIDRPARGVLYPPFKFTLHERSHTVVTPTATFTSTIATKLAVQPLGTIENGLTFTDRGIKAEYKTKAEVGLNELFSNVKFEVKDGRAVVAGALGQAAKVAGKTIYSTQVEVPPTLPPTVRYILKSGHIEGEAAGVRFKGQLSFTLEVRQNPQRRSPMPEPVHVVDFRVDPVWVGVVLLAGAVAIVASGGTATSAVAYSAAALLIGVNLPAKPSEFTQDHGL